MTAAATASTGTLVGATTIGCSGGGLLAGPVLDALGVERAFVVGHSAGGVIAMHAALDYTERLLGLVEDLLADAMQQLVQR